MKIYYGNGEVRLEGAVDIAAFEIRYKGRFTANSELPDSWFMRNNNRMVIGVSLGNVQPEVLFTYEGELRILSCRVTNRDLYQDYATPVAEGLGFWGSLNTNWEDFTQFPEDFDGTYVVGNIPNKTSIAEQTNIENFEVSSQQTSNTGGY
tara:strand:- start:314 stop:763 length:450 start_codon:yes stop_codon:yes gene_type:complete